MGYMKKLYNFFSYTLVVCVISSIVVISVPLSAVADSIWKVSVDGTEMLCVKDVIVKSVLTDPEEENGLPFNVEYWHLGNGGVIILGECKCDMDNKGFCIKGSFLRIEKSSIEEQKKIIDRWKKLGETVEVIDKNGDKFLVYNFGLNFNPPPGYGFISVGVSPQKKAVIELNKEGSNIRIDFSEIKSMDINGDEVTLLLHTGENVSGSLKYQYLSGKKLSPIFQGTDPMSETNIVEFELYFNRVRSVLFKE